MKSCFSKIRKHKLDWFEYWKATPISQNCTKPVNFPKP